MSVQDIADFESNLRKLCEFYRSKLTHAELVGTLDTVKMGYHIRTIQNFEETEVPAPVKEELVVNPNDPLDKHIELAPRDAGSPLPAEVADG